MSMIAHADTQSMSPTDPVVAVVVFLVLLAAFVVDLRWVAVSRRLGRTLDLPKGQYLRLVRTLSIDPVMDLLVVGAILWGDLTRNWEHAAAAAVGAAIGLAVGRYRFRIQYVRSVPEHHAVVMVRSRAEYVALVVLLLVRAAAEQHQIPVNGALTLLVTLLLSVCVLESIGRAVSFLRQYRRDTATGLRPDAEPGPDAEVRPAPVDA